MISQLVYVSSATTPFGSDDLAQILAVSRRNNVRNGVTGALLYSGGEILQALEGPETAVEGIYERIRADPRHHSVRTVLRGTASQRAFPDWSMGLRTADELPEDERDGVRSLFELTRTGPMRARVLLASFRGYVH